VAKGIACRPQAKLAAHVCTAAAAVASTTLHSLNTLRTGILSIMEALVVSVEGSSSQPEVGVLYDFNNSCRAVTYMRDSKTAAVPRQVGFREGSCIVASTFRIACAGRNLSRSSENRQYDDGSSVIEIEIRKDGGADGAFMVLRKVSDKR
jgi:hypothetical protein